MRVGSAVLLMAIMGGYAYLSSLDRVGEQLATATLAFLAASLLGRALEERLRRAFRESYGLDELWETGGRTMRVRFVHEEARRVAGRVTRLLVVTALTSAVAAAVSLAAAGDLGVVLDPVALTAISWW